MAFDDLKSENGELYRSISNQFGQGDV